MIEVLYRLTTIAVGPGFWCEFSVTADRSPVLRWVVRRSVLKLAGILKLTRVTTGFGAVANLWFVILWTRSNPKEHGHETLSDVNLFLLLGGGLLTGIGLYAFGATINDLLDVHRDRAMNPARPIIAGSTSIELAVCSVAGSLMIAVLGSTVFGTAAILATLVLALAVLMFNALGRFVPGIGMVLLSVIYAGHMLLPNMSMRFLVPAWVILTHAIVVTGLAHHLGRKSPPISRRAGVFAVVGWVFCSLILLALMWTRREDAQLWPSFVPISVVLYPVILAVLFAGLVIRRTRSIGTGPRLGEKIARYGAMWPALYATGWLLGTGLWHAAWWMLGLTAVGFLVMSVLREVYALAEHPAGYRRS